MRLWSLDPALLDRAALVAGWREGLLAQKVLAGQTKGYRNHPQLDRFKITSDPCLAIGAWLQGLAQEADARGYHFDHSKINCAGPAIRIDVTRGQLNFEMEHLRAKVAARQPDWLPRLGAVEAHPIFTVVDGGIEDWERP
ncbi:pyrimidine dimer DNA glycosylase/endonuclease V [Luteococcus sediminum]|uniref:pyrimidine dimer DNA glycosylase/endonuclease V n=1 Tax=Luteococcus sp. TaxID=1969402 RepID=UPI00373686AE